MLRVVTPASFVVTVLLSIFCLGVVGQDTSKIKPQGYSGGTIPDRLDYQFEYPSIKTKPEFKNPYEDIKVSNYHVQERRDKTDSILDNLSHSMASTQTKSANTTFDYNKINTDRFVNSPCITKLGFDSNKDPIIQEQLFKNCEEGLKEDEFVQIIVGLLVIIGLSGIFYVGIKAKKA